MLEVEACSRIGCEVHRPIFEKRVHKTMNPRPDRIISCTNVEVTDAQQRQKQRGVTFAAQAAAKVRIAEGCQFALLPENEIIKLIAAWYESCAQAMLTGNYALLGEWIREQAGLAAENDLEFADLVELLRLCRSAAMELERWDEDVFSQVGEVIGEELQIVRNKFTWTNSSEPDDLPEVAKKPESEMPGPELREPGPAGERRLACRVRLQLPVRARGMTTGTPMDVLTLTECVSHAGLYFLARGNFSAGRILKVTYPHWEGPGALNKEYTAQIVRVDSLPNGAQGVAIKFLESMAPSA